jgi:glycogen synthase
VGIENGIFGDSVAPFSAGVHAQANAGNFERLRTRKATYKRRFVKALQRVRDQRIIGKLKIDAADSRTPIFYMAGRLDFMQKGFDVMFYAFERLGRGKAKLFFCPSSSAGSLPDGLKFFKEFARKCPGDIEIWPFKIPRRLYDLFLKGSSFLLMPSLYEPFGSANEGLLSGTPIVARATGGLWLQVNSASKVPVPSFYGDLGLNGNQKFPTGILFREEYPDEEAAKEWRKLLSLAPEKRKEMPLFNALVDSAYGALKNAIEVYAKPELYARTVLNGVNEVRKFSWERAAQKYQEVYDVAANRGI